jgi:PII-like signaling protein
VTHGRRWRAWRTCFTRERQSVRSEAWSCPRRASMRMLHREGLSGDTIVRGVRLHGTGRGPDDVSGRRGREVVQFVESEENVARVLPLLRHMAPTRLITVHDVEVIP